MQILRTILLLFLSAAVFAQSGKFTVGTASAAPGEKVNGFIEVPAGSDAAMRIPITVIHGSKPGPVLALVAGAHGTEYASIIALERVIQHLEPAEVSGTVIVVPLVNPASFHEKVPHVNPMDHKSMNRYYPGNPNGTQTDRASYLITKQVVEQSDYLIDLHGGDLDESLRPYSYWSRTGDAKMDAASKGMVLAFGLDHIIIVTDRPRDPSASRYLDSTASSRGKPSIAAEAGYSGTVESDDVDALVAGCANVMRYLKILPGEAKPVEHPVWLSQVDTVNGDADGIFYPLVKRGNYVAVGAKLGYITDYFGKTISEPRASTAGVVLYVCGVPSMRKGETVANIGEVGKEP